MKKVLIAASILSADFGFLKEEIQKLEIAGADMIHLDIMDGHYVPNLTFGIPVIERIRSLTQLPLDAHLMVLNPDFFVSPLAEIGVKYISFHQETVYHSHRIIHKIKEHGCNAGLALNPAIPVSSVSEVLCDLDFVLVMSVNPGFSGQGFIQSSIAKISNLKKSISDLDLNTMIQVDGGVNDTNSAELIEAGADILVSASYIFKQSDYSKAIRDLKHV